MPGVLGPIRRLQPGDSAVVRGGDNRIRLIVWVCEKCKETFFAEFNGVFPQRHECRCGQEIEFTEVKGT